MSFAAHVRQLPQCSHSLTEIIVALAVSVAISAGHAACLPDTDSSYLSFREVECLLA